MRGRKPKPTLVKVLAGNPGKGPLNFNEPQPVGNAAEPPWWMSQAQKDLWNSKIAQAPVGLIKLLDQETLAVWIVAADTYQQAAAQVAKRGFMLKETKKGTIRQFKNKASTIVPDKVTLFKSPYLAIMSEQAGIMQKYGADLGFSPSSRSRIHVLPEGEGAGKTKGRKAGFDEFTEAAKARQSAAQSLESAEAAASAFEAHSLNSTDTRN